MTGTRRAGIVPRVNPRQELAAQFALMPMLVGLSILGLTVLTDDAALLPLAGVLCVYAGFSMNVAGVVLAVVGHVRARREGVALAQRWRVTGCLVALLVAAWPTAAVCFDAGIAWITRYSLRLSNRAQTPWLVELRGPGLEDALTIAPGEHTIRRYWFGGDGSLRLRADGREVEVEGYVTPNLRGDAAVMRNSDGSVVVRPRDD